MHPLLRFTLDLFEPNQPPALDKQGQTAIEKVAKKTAPNALKPSLAPALDASPAAEFQHPEANREITLDAVRVAYAFQRGQRRTIGFSVGPGGLVVRAPRWVTLAQVETALQEKSRWIVQKLGESRQRQAQALSMRLVWQHGMRLPYLGRVLTVLLDPLRRPRTGASLGDMLPPEAGEPAPCLYLALPLDASPVQIRAAVQRWLMAQARAHFTVRLNHFAPQLQVQWRQLGLSQAATRWGSARSDGAIRLNWRLMHFDLPVIDYVVAHELSHLRVMNHSPRFWDTVRSVMPDYEQHRRQLKTQPAPRWD